MVLLRMFAEDVVLSDSFAQVSVLTSLNENLHVMLYPHPMRGHLQRVCMCVSNPACTTAAHLLELRRAAPSIRRHGRNHTARAPAV